MDLRDRANRALIARSWLPDLAGAALAVVFLLFVSHEIPREHDRPLDALGNAILVLAGASMALVRRFPRIALVVVTAVLATYLVRDYPGGPVYLTGWIALFALSSRTSRRAALVWAAGFAISLTVAGLVNDDTDPWLHILVLIGWSAAAVFLGDALRNRRDYLAGLEERARSLEQSREEEARRQVAEERLRIARDLHDSVAHAMATINVQAGAAAHVVDRRPEAATEALSAIQRASADVLDELAALLGLLRDEDGNAARTPTPDLADLDSLVDATRAARLPVTLDIDGPVDAVPAPVSTAAYRIVQESLTNVLRHADASAATVHVRVGADRSLVVEVSDDGIGTNGSPNGAGMGIRGMRERAASTDGTLDAGPRHGGGFQVRAAWPARQ